MNYFLSPRCSLKWLEVPAVYHIPKDELYELDEPAFAVLERAASAGGCEVDESDRAFLDYALTEGILTTVGTGMKRPALRKSPRPSLRYLELQITRRCNLRCGHCYIGPPENRELPLNKIMRVLREFEEAQGLRLLITGGEPLLHRDFRQMNDALPDYAFRKILFTNGTLLGRRTLRSLHVDEIQMSVDGLEIGHDALRGKGAYRKTMNALDEVRDSGIDVSVSTMVHSANLNDFEEMERLFREKGVREWTVDVPCGAGNLVHHPSLQVSPEVAGRYLRYGFGEGLHGGGEGFACGLHLASVMADGKVARCAFHSESSVGDIAEGLETCWSRISPLALRELKCDCAVRELCRGGCRYRAKLLGDARGKDLYRCAAFAVPEQK